VNSRWAMIVAMVIPLCGTAAAQGRGGGAPGGAPAGPAQGGVTQGGVPQGGVPPGGGRGQFPVVPPGGAGFGSFPFGKSGGPSSSWGGRKGHGSGQVAPWAYTNVTTVLPPPYGPPPAPSFNDQAPDNWPPQVPPMMVQGPPPGWDPELNAYGPAPRQSFGMRTIQAPPAPPPAHLPGHEATPAGGRRGRATRISEPQLKLRRWVAWAATSPPTVPHSFRSGSQRDPGTRRMRRSWLHSCDTDCRA
jgi:hypothetical protein